MVAVSRIEFSEANFFIAPGASQVSYKYLAGYKFRLERNLFMLTGGVLDFSPAPNYWHKGFGIVGRRAQSCIN